nr:uncharacterized protein LOC109152108 [Ipomoea batatas]
MKFLLAALNVAYVLSTPKPVEQENETLKATCRRFKWENDDLACRGHILNGMSDTLFDIYQCEESSKDLQEKLEGKCIYENASSKKFLTSCHLLGKRYLDVKKEELTMEQLGSHLYVKEGIRLKESKNEGIAKATRVSGFAINFVGEGKSSGNRKGKGKPGKTTKSSKFKKNGKRKREGICYMLGVEGSDAAAGDSGPLGNESGELGRDSGLLEDAELSVGVAGAPPVPAKLNIRWAASRRDLLVIRGPTSTMEDFGVLFPGKAEQRQGEGHLRSSSPSLGDDGELVTRLRRLWSPTSLVKVPAWKWQPQLLFSFGHDRRQKGASDAASLPVPQRRKVADRLGEERRVAGAACEIRIECEALGRSVALCETLGSVGKRSGEKFGSIALCRILEGVRLCAEHS